MDKYKINKQKYKNKHHKQQKIVKKGQFLNVQSVAAPDFEQCPVFVKEITQPLFPFIVNI